LQGGDDWGCPEDKGLENLHFIKSLSKFSMKSRGAAPSEAMECQSQKKGFYMPDMPAVHINATAYSLLPVSFMLIGGVLSLLKTPPDKFIRAAHQFAAGSILAAIAIELLPKLTAGNFHISLAGGFTLALIIMIYLKHVSGRLQQGSLPPAGYPRGLVLSNGVDLAAVGALLGIAMYTGVRQGQLIVVAISIQLLFLGATYASDMKKRGVSIITNLVTLVGLVVLLYAFNLSFGYLMDVLPQAWYGVMIAFGAAALLFLVLEELWLEAPKSRDPIWATSIFFLGFLFIFLLETHRLA